MLGKLISCSLGFSMAASALFAADTAHPSATLKVSDLTAIPGKTLPPGTYSIQLVDHLSDRYVVRVQGSSGGDSTLFIGIPDNNMPKAENGMVMWKTPAAGAAYLRGWKFNGTAPLEFAYPKADAVAIAKANNTQVAAIDPESEGMNNKASLSRDEMQIITLWLLTPTHVGANSPAGIKAAKYQQIAGNHTPQKPVVSKLPHTASMLPWFWLIGTFSIAGAFSVRGLRFASTTR